MINKQEKITCITNSAGENISYKYLTTGKEYEVVEVQDGYYVIVDDDDYENRYPFRNFHTKQQIREINLNKLLS